VTVIVAMAASVISIGFRTKQLAAKRGWGRVLLVTLPALLLGVGLSVAVNWRRMHRHPQRTPAAAAATPPPAAAATPPASNAAGAAK
jgi:hypothetical protein